MEETLRERDTQFGIALNFLLRLSSPLSYPHSEGKLEVLRVGRYNMAIVIRVSGTEEH
jgi:hypothetical protein